MEFDEENVLAEMAEALDVDLDDLDISQSHLEDFGDGDAFTVTTGRKEWTVVPDEDVAEAIALSVVTQDLEHEPEIFDKNFIEGHINQKALKQWVREAAYDYDYFEDMSRNAEEFWEEAARWGHTVPEFEEDEDGDEIIPDPEDDDIDALATAMAEERAEDPMSWMEEIWGDEASAKAMEVAGFDIESAAEEAVSIDGWPHFIARYDGNYDTTEAGFVFWRDN